MIIGMLSTTTAEEGYRRVHLLRAALASGWMHCQEFFDIANKLFESLAVVVSVDLRENRR